ncbi:MAG TPA: histidinol-phosphatase [Spirochaetia bacterium]|nr:histidinol-phosphatase [Spirochaetia bacterium]
MTDGPRVLYGNYHQHTHHCDGNGVPRDYAEAALAKGMPRIGFTGHNVVPFKTEWTMPAERLPGYLAEVRAAKEEYRGRLEIFLGIEADYIPGMTSPVHQRIQSLGLDFVLGSVHFVGPRDGDHDWTVDGPRQEIEAMIRDGFGGSARRAVERYYELVAQMARTAPPDIFAHLDIVKKNNRDGGLFDEQAAWYREAVRGALEAVRDSGKVMEINTGGVVRNTSGAYYPSPWILAEARAHGIPVMINADAHQPQNIDGKFAEAAELLKAAGYRTQRQLTTTGWIDIPL